MRWGGYYLSLFLQALIGCVRAGDVSFFSSSGSWVCSRAHLASMGPARCFGEFFTMWVGILSLVHREAIDTPGGVLAFFSDTRYVPIMPAIGIHK